jgi:hypothetical protein
MATPEQFFDPFFSHKVSGGLTDGKDDLGLPVTGQGTIAIQTNAKDLLNIQVRTDTMGAPSLNLEIGSKEWKLFYQGVSGTVDMSPFVLRTKSEQDCWLRQDQDPTVYWLSLDNNNGRLRYGKWFTNTSMVLLELNLKHLFVNPAEGDSMVWNNPDRDAWLEGLKDVTVTADQVELTVSSLCAFFNIGPVSRPLTRFGLRMNADLYYKDETGWNPAFASCSRPLPFRGSYRRC